MASLAYSRNLFSSKPFRLDLPSFSDNHARHLQRLIVSFLVIGSSLMPPPSGHVALYFAIVSGKTSFCPDELVPFDVALLLEEGSNTSSSNCSSLSSAQFVWPLFIGGLLESLLSEQFNGLLGDDTGDCETIKGLLFTGGGGVVVVVVAAAVPTVTVGNRFGDTIPAIIAVTVIADAVDYVVTGSWVSGAVITSDEYYSEAAGDILITLVAWPTIEAVVLEVCAVDTTTGGGGSGTGERGCCCTCICETVISCCLDADMTVVFG
uniref:Uncharacterized protein n=1 Tax=Glossina brevipalpis TaxID=37001 RepID=A0A1A9X436_9MUSC